MVAVVNDSTRDAILAQQKLELRRTLEQIIPNELHDNPLEESCILLQDKDALGTTQPMPLISPPKMPSRSLLPSKP